MPKPGAVFARADADLGGNRRFLGNLDLLLARDKFQGTEEAGGIAGGEKLFGIGAGRTVATELLGNGQRHVQDAVIGNGAAGAAAGGRGLGRIENRHDNLLWLVLRLGLDFQYRTIK